MKKANQDIRNKIETNCIKYWQVALKYGIDNTNFSKKLRVELNETDKAKINNIIDSLIKENEN